MHKALIPHYFILCVSLADLRPAEAGLDVLFLSIIFPASEISEVQADRTPTPLYNQMGVMNFSGKKYPLSKHRKLLALQIPCKTLHQTHV